LGSSGASSAATAFALAKLFDIGVSETDLLRIAGEGEALVAGAPHYDNVAASLFGGVVLIDILKERVYRIRPPTSMYIAIVAPRGVATAEKKTGLARSMLPKTIDFEVHVKQQASLAKLVYALMSGDIEALGEAISSDFVVEPHRASLIPYYYDLKRMALDMGALGFNISGAGPSVFLIHRSCDEARYVGEKLISFLKDKGLYSDLILTRVSDKGAEVVG